MEVVHYECNSNRKWYLLGRGSDKKLGLHCNHYLIIDNGEGILFDPGSVLDFETVYNNITKLIPLEQINYVVLHHQDPDLCSSIPLFEKADAIFRVAIHWRAATLIKYYGIVSPFYIINENEFKLRLRSGRELVFITTPYLLFQGAFATYDSQIRSSNRIEIQELIVE